MNDSLEVVEVVKLGGGQEGEVVAAVGDGGADQSQAVPHAGGGDVGAQNHRTGDHGQQVGDLTEGTKRLRNINQNNQQDL